jgi:DNA-binding NarL/FixJ family response regulator
MRPDGLPENPERSISVLIVSPVCLYREGIIAMLDQHPTVEVIGAAESVDALVAGGNTMAARVILIDVLAGVNQGESIRRLRAAVHRAAIVALTVVGEKHAIELAEAGATGLVALDASMQDLIGAIRCAARGEAICTPSLTAALMRRLAALASERQPDGRRESLTFREREVVELLEEGLSNKQIAQRLRIQLPTVKNHVHSILGKLGAERRIDIIAMARSRTNSL